MTTARFLNIARKVSAANNERIDESCIALREVSFIKTPPVLHKIAAMIIAASPFLCAVLSKLKSVNVFILYI